MARLKPTYIRTYVILSNVDVRYGGRLWSLSQLEGEWHTCMHNDESLIL
jgi:hypothetical protein